jgi:hypothetical protein
MISALPKAVVGHLSVDFFLGWWIVLNNGRMGQNQGRKVNRLHPLLPVLVGSTNICSTQL